MATIPVPRRQPIASMRRDPSAIWHHVDGVMVAAVLAIAGLGVLMVYSSTRGAEAPFDTSFVTRQAFFMVLGLIAMAITALIDYRAILDRAPLIYGGTVFLLAGRARWSGRADPAPRAGSSSGRSSSSRRSSPRSP